MRELSPSVLDVLSRHAVDTYPRECCGFVLADGTVHHAVNIQDKLNADQPDRYMRTASNGYTLSVADTLRLKESFDTDNPAVMLYHSHPDVGSYFSAEDKEKALFEEEPIYPIDYLVIDVRLDGAHEAKLFSWCAPEFVCVVTYTLVHSPLMLQ